MGMSASQARYLSLIARQSNLEYQGQQINQERTILSQQVTDLYNSLLAMEVPTPPSTRDYTSIQYSGKSGATTYSFNASDVKPGKDGGYIVTLGYTDYGHSLSRNNGYAATSQGYEEVTGKRFSVADTKTTESTRTVAGIKVNETNPDEAPSEGFFKKVAAPPTSGAYYVYDESGTALVQGGQGYVDNEQGPYFVLSTDPSEYDSSTCLTKSGDTTVNVTTDVAPKVTITEKDLDNLYEVDSDGNITKAEKGIDYIINTDGSISLVGNGEFFIEGSGTDTVKRGTQDGYKIAGNTAMTMEEYKATFSEKTMDTYNGYVEAIKNSGLVDSSGNPYTEKDFMVYLDGDKKPHFALASDVKDNDTCVTYDYLSNGKYTKKVTHENAKLNFDAASGRITSVDIPVEDAKKNVVSWTTITLEAEEVTDENAYNDAMADYEYAQYQYDKAQQEINAKTEVIQQQDRNLELKLQRLDNERTQITTEIEALEKVINDNIESSYKTFSG